MPLRFVSYRTEADALPNGVPGPRLPRNRSGNAREPSGIRSSAARQRRLSGEGKDAVGTRSSSLDT